MDKGTFRMFSDAKPGGCLDPSSDGEDYAYAPAIPSQLSKHSDKPLIFSNTKPGGFLDPFYGETASKLGNLKHEEYKRNKRFSFFKKNKDKKKTTVPNDDDNCGVVVASSRITITKENISDIIMTYPAIEKKIESNNNQNIVKKHKRVDSLSSSIDNENQPFYTPTQHSLSKYNDDRSLSLKIGVIITNIDVQNNREDENLLGIGNNEDNTVDTEMLNDSVRNEHDTTKLKRLALGDLHNKEKQLEDSTDFSSNKNINLDNPTENEKILGIGKNEDDKVDTVIPIDSVRNEYDTTKLKRLALGDLHNKEKQLEDSTNSPSNKNIYLDNPTEDEKFLGIGKNENDKVDTVTPNDSVRNEYDTTKLKRLALGDLYNKEKQLEDSTNSPSNKNINLDNPSEESGINATSITRSRLKTPGKAENLDSFFSRNTISEADQYEIENRIKNSTSVSSITTNIKYETNSENNCAPLEVKDLDKDVSKVAQLKNEYSPKTDVMFINKNTLTKSDESLDNKSSLHESIEDMQSTLLSKLPTAKRAANVTGSEYSQNVKRDPDTSVENFDKNLDSFSGSKHHRRLSTNSQLKPLKQPTEEKDVGDVSKTTRDFSSDSKQQKKLSTDSQLKSLLSNVIRRSSEPLKPTHLEEDNPKNTQATVQNIESYGPGNNLESLNENVQLNNGQMDNLPDNIATHESSNVSFPKVNEGEEAKKTRSISPSLLIKNTSYIDSNFPDVVNENKQTLSSQNFETNEFTNQSGLRMGVSHDKNRSNSSLRQSSFKSNKIYDESTEKKSLSTTLLRQDNNQTNNNNIHQVLNERDENIQSPVNMSRGSKDLSIMTSTLNNDRSSKIILNEKMESDNNNISPSGNDEYKNKNNQTLVKSTFLENEQQFNYNNHNLESRDNSPESIKINDRGMERRKSSPILVNNTKNSIERTNSKENVLRYNSSPTKSTNSVKFDIDSYTNLSNPNFDIDISRTTHKPDDFIKIKSPFSMVTSKDASNTHRDSILPKTVPKFKMIGPDIKFMNTINEDQNSIEDCNKQINDYINYNLCKIYETELIPLRNTIRDLRKQIDCIVKEQEKFIKLLRNVQKVKPIKHSAQQCACAGRKY